MAEKTAAARKPRALTSTVPVHCAHTRLVRRDSLKPNPRNPNTHPPEQIALLAGILKGQGWRAPITVSLRSGFIVRGHARLEAAAAAELDVVPIDEQQYASDDLELADLIADNRIAELAVLDTGLTAELIGSFQEGFDQLLTGFDAEAMVALMKATELPKAPGEFSEVDESIETAYCCPKCGYRWSGKATSEP